MDRLRGPAGAAPVGGAARGGAGQAGRRAPTLRLGLVSAMACLAVTSCLSLTPRKPLVVLHPESTAEFRRLIEVTTRPVLVVFTSESCVSCRALEATLDELATDYRGRLVVLQADLAKTGGLIQEYNLLKVPTTIILRNGQEVARRHGALPPLFMKPFIDEALRPSAP